MWDWEYIERFVKLCLKCVTNVLYFRKMLRIKLESQTRQIITNYRNTFHQTMVFSYELSFIDCPYFVRNFCAELFIFWVTAFYLQNCSQIRGSPLLSTELSIISILFLFFFAIFGFNSKRRLKMLTSNSADDFIFWGIFASYASKAIQLTTLI